MTIIEAMGTGLPMAATAVGGVPDMAPDGVAAVLTSCDVQAVCDACCKLLGDAKLRETLGRNALQRSRLFSAEQMAKSYSNLYHA